MSGKLTEITDGERQALVKRHLSGETYSDLAGFAGLDLQQIRQLFKQTKMQDLLASEQGYFDLTTARARLRLHMLGDRAVDKQERLMDSKSEEMQFKASRFILESILPKTEKHVGEVTLNLKADIEMLAHVSDALTTARVIPSGNGKDHQIPSYAPYVLTGTEGIEIAEPSDPEPQLGPGGPVGSGLAQERDPDGKPEPPTSQ